MIISEVISAVFQVFIFSLVPFLTYISKAKKVKGFLGYIGLIVPQKKTMIFSLVIAFLFVASSYFIYGWFDLLEVLKSPGTVGGEIRELGFGHLAIIIIFIKSVFVNGLSEEILFRGFIGKRLSERFGFVNGNATQALIFGLLHGILTLAIADYGVVIVITIVTGVIGYLLGYLNERLGNGSIVPSWTAHTLTNIIAFSIIGFLI